MIRVQIPAYLDHWMRGDRYGVVEKTYRRPAHKRGTADTFVLAEYHKVRLDKSGKAVVVLADDCTEIA